MLNQVVRGPLLVPLANGRVEFHADGALVADVSGTLRFVGAWEELRKQLSAEMPVRTSVGVMIPPLLDIHTHIPQHPIRGRFVEGVPHDAPNGRLLEGLRRRMGLEALDTDFHRRLATVRFDLRGRCDLLFRQNRRR